MICLDQNSYVIRMQYIYIAYICDLYVFSICIYIWLTFNLYIIKIVIYEQFEWTWEFVNY